MELDYTAGCVNFRDVGEYINLIVNNHLLPVNRLFRGGKTDFVKSSEEVKNPKTIINLRTTEDVLSFGAANYHFPLGNNLEKYHTEQKEVQVWLNNVIGLFEDENLQYPVLIHCLSGKDRTGIVVATLLLILGIKKKFIVEEYLLSEGEVSVDLIDAAISGIGEPSEYFKRLDLDKIRKNIMSSY